MKRKTKYKVKGTFWTIREILQDYNPSVSKTLLAKRLANGWELLDALHKPAEYKKPFSTESFNLSRLTNRETEILEKRSDGKNYAIIGREMGISRERVRQIMLNVNSKLERPVDK